MAQRTTQKHVDEAVQAASALHERHYHTMPAAQRMADRVTFALGRPLAAVALSVAIVAWLIVHFTLARAGVAFDPQLTALDTFGTLAALLMTVLILATENRQNELSERRAQLTLQMVLVVEQKLSKTLELLERAREERGRGADQEAREMTQPTEVRSAIEALDEAHQTILNDAFGS